jgi:fatty acid-binding protein DegV
LQVQTRALYPEEGARTTALIAEITPALGVHAGPGAIGLVAVKAK